MLFNNSPILESPTPPGELTGQELEFGYWYFIHKPLFRKIMTIVLVVICVLVWGRVIWGVVDYFRSPSEADTLARLANSATDFSAWRELYKPLPLEIGEVQVAKASADTYDVLAKITNPNTKWGIPKLNYTFVVEGEEITGESFLLPEESKFIAVYGVKQSAVPKNNSVLINNSPWQKVGAQDIFTRVPDLKISEEQVEPITLGALSGWRLRAKLTNNSPYNFWEVKNTALLWRSGAVMAISEQKVRQLVSGEARVIEFTWFANFGTPDQVKIVPEVNTFEAKSVVY